MRMSEEQHGEAMNLAPAAPVDTSVVRCHRSTVGHTVTVACPKIEMPQD